MISWIKTNWNWAKIHLKIYWDTAADVILIVVTTLLASIIKLINYKLHKVDITFLDFFKDGTFVMYAFSFFISAYIIYNFQLKGTNSKNQPKIILPIILMLSLIFTELDKSKNDKNTDSEFIYLISIIPFIASLIVFYLAQLRYNKDNQVVDVRQGYADKQGGIQDALS